MPAARTTAYRLVIGNKRTSSWSLRPWLLMRQAGLAFEEIRVNLRASDAKAQILRHSPTGQVPALEAGALVIPDSLAISEFLADAHPDLGLWPADRLERARARAISAEMHAGFRSLRQEMPFAILERRPGITTGPEALADIARIVAIWRQARSAALGRGPFLFGAFSIADAMYAPVASRLETYEVDVARLGDDGTAADYVRTIMALPAIAQWREEAGAEPH